MGRTGKRINPHTHTPSHSPAPPRPNPDGHGALDDGGLDRGGLVDCGARVPDRPDPIRPDPSAKRVARDRHRCHAGARGSSAARGPTGGPKGGRRDWRVGVGVGCRRWCARGAAGVRALGGCTGRGRRWCSRGAAGVRALGGVHAGRASDGVWNTGRCRRSASTLRCARRGAGERRCVEHWVVPQGCEHTQGCPPVAG